MTQNGRLEKLVTLTPALNSGILATCRYITYRGKEHVK